MTSDISLFFTPVADHEPGQWPKGTIGQRIRVATAETGFSDIGTGAVVLFGVAEYRRTQAEFDDHLGFTDVRNALYGLADHFKGVEVHDLGDIHAGETPEDTYFALSETISYIVKKGAIAIYLGGGQDLTYANYLAYEKLEQVVNLVAVDSRFDIGDAEEEVSSDRYLQKIILHQPNILFNFSNLGYQTHHIQPSEMELMQKMFFDIYRLGEVQQHLEAVEPVVRTADAVSFDLSSIRASDLPANARSEPNGLFGHEACAIARYAGLSDKLSSIGLTEFSNVIDRNGRSTALVAQILWYFIYGVSSRKRDYPFTDKSEYIKYTVTIKDGQYDIIFYKSPKSDRWWMEVPYPSKRGVKYERHFMVPCTYADYELACNEEIPDRWWQTFQKLG